MAETNDRAERLLAEKYGPNYREVLGLVDNPYAETDDAAFWDVFGDLGCDPAPDLTTASQSTEPPCPRVFGAVR